MPRPAHVEHLHRRQRPAPDAARQRQVRQPLPRLRPRRGRAGEEGAGRAPDPLLRDVTGVVARVALVLVGRVVLLVDHDQPEVADRGEDGGARADGDPGLARPQPPPLVVALALAERGVQQRHGVAEARAEPPHGLRRERDLGHEHDHAPPALERRGRRAEVDLGLARAGDPVEQLRAALARSRRPRRAARRSARPRRRRARRSAATGAGRAARSRRARAPPAAAARTDPGPRRAAARRSARAGSPSGARRRAAPPSARPTARSAAARAAAARARAPAPASSSTRPPSTARARPAPRGPSPRAPRAG